PGEYDIVRAIQESSNTFFFWLMDRIVNTYSIDRWHKLASSFGLGQPTGIELPNESPGILPDSSYLNRVLVEETWDIGVQLSLVVRQRLMVSTTVQLTKVIAHITNRDNDITPHLVHVIKKSNSTTNPAADTTKISWVDSNNIEVIKEGMRR